jgi:RND family efflux transporter MFP subunit
LVSAILLLVGAGAWMFWVPAMPEALVVSKNAAPARFDGGLRVSSVVAGPAIMTRAVRITGTLVARDEVSIGTALQDLRLAVVYAEDGDQVVAGQILARLETEGLDAQLRQAQAAVARAQAMIEQQEAVAAEAQANLLRIAPLGRSGAVSEQQIDERRAQTGSAAASLKAAYAELSQAQSQLADASAQRMKADIRSPAKGLISERSARAGALASSTQPLFRLTRHGQIELEADVSENDLPDIALDSPARIEVAGFAEPIEGRIRLVASKVDPQTRLGKVRIALPPHRDLRAGAYAKSTVEIERLSVPVTVPQRAVTTDAKGATSVMLIDDSATVSHAVRRVIGVARRSGDAVEVTSGLKAGDRVVAGASPFVRDGDTVRIAGIFAPKAKGEKQ